MTDTLKLPTSFEETIDFLYEVQNMADATEKAEVLWPILRAAASAKPVAWQPIKTAPHETRVLLGWRQQNGDWFSETGMASHGWRRESISNISYHGYATHWQPLPEGPANE